MNDNTKHNGCNGRKACARCPYTKQSRRGDLGGSPVQVWLGQTVGPFFLPCISAPNYKGNDTPATRSHPQCVGAAVMRARIGVDVMMPEPLLSMPADADDNVFPSLVEFIMHHTGAPLGLALMASSPPILALAFEEQLQVALEKGRIESVEQATHTFNSEN